MRTRNTTAFTIVELLVVISIIALLVGILVPAVNKARDTARTTQSKSNMHQVTIALSNYTADWNGDQYTTAPPNLSSGGRLGMTVGAAISNWVGEYGGDKGTPVGIRLGEIPYGGTAAIAFWNNSDGVAPYNFASGNTSTGKQGFGTWRYPNALQVAEYMDSKPLHPAYFSPKDSVCWRVLEPCFSLPGTLCVASVASHWGLPVSYNSVLYLAPSSYSISPTLMYNSRVYAYDEVAGTDFIDPMDIPSGFRPSTKDQAKFPNLKSWLMEHHWLQNRASQECGLNYEGTWMVGGDGSWDGCEPWHFNHSYKSQPVTVFADGHVETFEVAQAQRDDQRVSSDNGMGLWHRNTGDQADAYYVGRGSDWTVWSGHTHTVDGVRGRDVLAK